MTHSSPDGDTRIEIWVDADACPVRVRETLCRAADRRQLNAIFVANQAIRLPRSPYVHARQVIGGFDEADNHIAENCQSGDLVITADIPLAARAVERGATALNPRGTLYTRENIENHLSRRNFMEQLRSTGEVHGGPPALTNTDIQAFANALDRYLTAHS